MLFKVFILIGLNVSEKIWPSLYTNSLIYIIFDGKHVFVSMNGTDLLIIFFKHKYVEIHFQTFLLIGRYISEKFYERLYAKYFLVFILFFVRNMHLCNRMAYVKSIIFSAI